jgi:hypothetical protein
MIPDASADTAVLASAILMLLAITTKLITANLVTRSKRIYTKLDARRREIASRLKEVQLKTKSAKGTLEFWERRKIESSQKVEDARRDVEEYGMQSDGEFEEAAANADVDANPSDASVEVGTESSQMETADSTEGEPQATTEGSEASTGLSQSGQEPGEEADGQDGANETEQPGTRLS